MAMLKEEVGSKIRELRVKKGLTVAALARSAGVSRPNLHKLESGTYNCSLDILEKLLNVLDANFNIT